jgi:hypothetical protein
MLKTYFYDIEIRTKLSMRSSIIIHGSASNTSIKSTSSSSAAYAISVATNACCSAVNTSYFSANMCFSPVSSSYVTNTCRSALNISCSATNICCNNTNTDHSSSNTCGTVAQVWLITLAIVKLRPAAVLLMRVVVLKHY